MSTALAAQLAQIRGRNVNPLDLKAQKAAHSQSLLYEPSHAASQDFDTIYRLCREGFEDLCQLDSRFVRFSSSIFGEQSKSQDREQMTKTQNEELDRVLEDFLCLVGARISLKPATKAIEWIIRRFRVHEKNTNTLVLAFLPYHNSPIFVTLLSILPPNLNQRLKFLYPYAQSRANPPRHVVTHTASYNKSFLAALSTFVLETCQKRYQYQALVSFWASITTEALVAMADQGRSARRESRQENSENVLRLILPILNDGLSISDCPELRIGCYMILTVLTSKFDLEDRVLSTLMTAVVSDWKTTSHAGLICLSVLAERANGPDLPPAVLKKVLSLPNVVDDLTVLQRQYEVKKLVLGSIRGILGRVNAHSNLIELSYIDPLLTTGFLPKSARLTGARNLISTLNRINGQRDDELQIHYALVDLILNLAEKESIKEEIVTALEQEMKAPNPQIPQRLQELIIAPESAGETSSEDVTMLKSDGGEAYTDFHALASRIPTRTAYEISFLSHSDSYVYGSLAQTFTAVHRSKPDIKKFCELPVLRRSLAMTEPLFLSFFTRFWVGQDSAQARASALEVVSGYIKEQTVSSDVQILIPYMISALADRQRPVRRAAAKLARVLSSSYSQAFNAGQLKENHQIFGKDQIYGQNEKFKAATWISSEDANRLVTEVLLPRLEECALDGKAVVGLIRTCLEGSKSRKDLSKSRKDLKTSSRTAIFSFLCSHVITSSLYDFKIHILGIVNGVEGVGTLSRAKMLLPLLSEVLGPGKDLIIESCKQQGVDSVEFMKQVILTISPSEREGLHLIKDYLMTDPGQLLPDLDEAVFEKLSAIWNGMKPDLQSSMSSALLTLSLKKPEDNRNVKAVELLHSVRLSSTVLESLLEEANSLLSELRANVRPTKRRRTTQSADTDTTTPIYISEDSVRKITLILEVTESSTKTKGHLALLKVLFHLLDQLLFIQTHANQTIGYLQIQTMDEILSVLPKSKEPTNTIDASTVRADLLVEYIRITTQPQVRNKALLLVAAIADIAPDLVLHNVMPIFTYMGTSILRQNDEFSAHVIQQTMESVVSRLVLSLKEDSKNAFPSFCELLLSFAAAFEHIPEERRVHLFTSLVAKLGAADYLFALLVILSDKFPENQKVQAFCVQLCGRYNGVTLLTTMEKFLHFNLDIRRRNRTENITSLLTEQDQGETEILLKLLPLAQIALGSEAIRSKISKTLRASSQDAESRRQISIRIFENLFTLSQLCGDNDELKILCNQALQSFLTSMPTTQLINSLETLFEQSNEHIQKEILISFEQRLSLGTKIDNQDSQEACFALVPNLLNTIQTSSDAELQKSAVRTLDGIVEKIGKTNINTIADAARSICEGPILDSPDTSLKVVSLLCLNTMIEISGDLVTPLIPIIFSKIMECLDVSISEDTEDADLHNAGFSLLSSLIIYLPWTVTGPSLDRVLKISHESANADMGFKCDQFRVQMLHSIPTKNNISECLEALNRTWQNAMIEGAEAVKEHFGVFRLIIDRQSKSKIARESELLGDILIKAFSLRHIQLSPRTSESFADSEIEDVENAVNESAVAMVYKLNDASFRPMFLRFVEWATTFKKTGGRYIFRQTTWFSFLYQFFSTLKSIVTNYASLVLDNVVEVLNSIEPRNEDFMELWQKVLATLQESIEHDQDEFYQNPSHFNPINRALLAQLSHAASLPNDKLTTLLIPTITSLAAVTDSNTQHKDLNTDLLAHLRSQDAAVRLAAVRCERSLTDRLGDEWMVLLPEMLPYINELQEDDDEEVERETLAWIKRIEEVVGERIDGMLQ